MPFGRASALSQRMAQILLSLLSGNPASGPIFAGAGSKYRPVLAQNLTCLKERVNRKRYLRHANVMVESW